MNQKTSILDPSGGDSQGDWAIPEGERTDQKNRSDGGDAGYLPMIRFSKSVIGRMAMKKSPIRASVLGRSG